MLSRLFVRTIITFSFTLLLQTLFFILYYQALGLAFSFNAFIYILFGSLICIGAMLLFKRSAAAIGLTLFVALLTIYALINFAFFRVFHTFWRAQLDRVAALNRSMLELLSDFVYLIPAWLWGMSFAVVAGSGVAFFLFASFLRKNLHWQSSKIRLGAPVAGIALIAFASISMYFFTSHLVHQLSKQSYDRERILSELSLYGFLLQSGFSQPSSVSAAQVSEAQPQQEETLVHDEPSDFAILRERIAGLSQAKPRAAALPQMRGTFPHIVIYQMESVASWAADMPGVMPFFTQLKQHGITADRFFSNSCMTINAEFSTLCSFLPESYGPMSDLYASNTYACLPEILSSQYRYSSTIYHANDPEFWNRTQLAPAWGFNELKFSPDYQYRQNDASILQDIVEDIKAADAPTLHYLVGFTSHAPHNKEFRQAHNAQGGLQMHPFHGDIDPSVNGVEIDEQTIREYLGNLRTIDQGIELFFQRLSKEGLLEDTIVIIFGDHRYYNFKTENKVNDFLRYNELPFVMVVPKAYGGTNPSIASQMDIAPTILHLLEGSMVHLPEQFIGHSLLDPAHPQNALSKCLGEVSYIDEQQIIKGDASLQIYNQLLGISNAQAQEQIRLITQTTDDLIRQNRLQGQEGQADFVPELVFTQETDTDQDGLSDLREKTIATNRLNKDTDGDGFLDGVEVANGYDPLGPGRR